MSQIALARTVTENILLIEKAHTTMSDAGSFRSWLNIGREALRAEWFSARGIAEKFDVHYTTFFKQFFKEGSKYYAASILDEAQIDAFAQALVDRLNGSLTAQPTQSGAPVRAYEAPAAPIIHADDVEVRAERKKTSASFNLMLPLDEMVQAAVENHIEESGILKNIADRIKEEAQKLRPTMIQIGERTPVVIHGRTHNKFKKTLTNLIRYKQTYIAGPAGTGKTTLGEQTAKALSLPFGHISCTLGMNESHLLGRMNAHGDYLPSEFIRMYENGGVFLFDEIDAADANTMLVLNSALANGRISVPNRVEKPYAERSADFYILCAANTWGFGSNEYVGRNILDAAFLDRFAGAQVLVDYDRELEAEIAKEFPEVAESIWKIRANVKTNRIRRVVSTRAIVNGVIARTEGDTLVEYLSDFLLTWTEEEKKKAMQGV